MLYETDENNFYIELQTVLNDLLNDKDTEDYGKYFKSMYCNRVDKWAYFNRKYIGINTNMYLEALHKNIKHCNLDGKQCKRLDLSINALMALVRDKSFERIIKITKKKKSHKINQIIAAHNKSLKITSDMVMRVDDYWLVNSETEVNLKYKVEKTLKLCKECVLTCDKCKICIHTYKCSCMNNIIYFNICKHIHACAKSEMTDNLPRDENQIFLSPPKLVVDNGFKRIVSESDLKIKNKEEIKNKLETIYGMVSGNETHIIKQCDKIISKLTEHKRFKQTTNEGNKRNIELQDRFHSKKKVLSQQHTLSNLEGKHIRESLQNMNKDLLNISTSATFDHSYI